MPIIWSILWGLLTPAAMMAVMKYWVPRLADIAEEPADECANDDKKHVPGQYLPRTPFFQTTQKQLITLIICGIFAAVCGYVAADRALNALSFLRMWLAFTVLACITVTDAELMLIPNKCSLVLLAGGVLLLGVQWILDGAFPAVYAIECAISGVICLILLLIMAAVTRGGFGMGDVKIVSSLGFLCGIRTVCYVLTLALVVCALSSTLLLLTKKKQLKDLLPLGPFLWLAMGISIILRLI